jgi:hypothetical protein
MNLSFLLRATPNSDAIHKKPLTKDPPRELFLALGRLLSVVTSHLVVHIPGSLETLHLSGLELAEVLSAQVYSAELVTHGVGRHVLLSPLLVGPGLLHGLLPHGLLGLLDSAHSKVHAGTHLLDLDSRHLLAAALGGDEVDSEVDDGLVVLADGLLGGDGDHVLQTLDVNLVGALALEEVEEEALGLGVLVGDGAVKGGSGKDNHGAQADGELAALELVNLAVALGVEVELEHVEGLVAKEADHGQGVRALLGAAAKDHEGGVVLLGEELERGGVLEGVDGVLLGELLG